MQKITFSHISVSIMHRARRCCSMALAAMWLAAVTVIVSSGLSSCSSSGDEPNGNGNGDNACKLGIYIKLGDTFGSLSRATTTGGYDPGQDFENYIHLADLTPDYRVYLLDTNDRLIDEVYHADIALITATPGSKIYELRFDVTKIFSDKYNNGSFKLLMLANWYGKYPGGLEPGVTTLSDIVESQIAVADYKAWPAEISADSRIPMFGIVQFDNVDLKPKSLVLLNKTLYLLRALAKVEVIDSPASEDQIQSVSLTRFNTRYSMAPAGINHQDDYVRNDYVADNNLSLTIPPGCESDVPLSFSRNAAGSFICYVPEFRNIGRDDNEKSRLLVTYPDGKTYYVDFKYYQSPPAGSLLGEPFDLHRNYWYRYSLSRHLEIDVEVVVVPYAETVLNPEFGLQPPVPDDHISNFNPVVNPADTTIIYYRNFKTGACLAPDKATVIDDPQQTIDSTTGYQIVQTRFPGRGNVVYFYYDPVRKVQLAPDRKTYVRTVFSVNEPGYVIYIELLDLGNNKFVPTGQAYYFQSYTNVWYSDIPTRDDVPTIVNPYPAP